MGLRTKVDVERWTRDGELALGVDEHHRVVSIPFGQESGGGHTLVVGATGSGKTVTQTSIATHAIEQGMGAIILDPKGDRSMREHVRRAALDAGRDFLEWSPRGDCVYNPYALGSSTVIADKALSGEQFTEPHYLRQAQRYLGHVVRALRQREIEVSLATIVEHMDPGRLEMLAPRCPRSRHGQRSRTRLPVLAPARRAVGGARPAGDPRGVRSRPMAGSADARCPAVRSAELGAATSDRLLRPGGRQAGRCSLRCWPRRSWWTCRQSWRHCSDPSAHVGRNRRVLGDRGRPGGEAVRARPLGGIQTRPGHSGDLLDLRLPGHERLLEQVLGDLSVLIAHRQVVPSSAELISEVAGVRGTWRVSRHSDGRSTRTRAREPVLGTDRVMSLTRGWGAVLVCRRLRPCARRADLPAERAPLMCRPEPPARFGARGQDRAAHAP